MGVFSGCLLAGKEPCGLCKQLKNIVRLCPRLSVFFINTINMLASFPVSQILSFLSVLPVFIESCGWYLSIVPDMKVFLI